MFLAVFSFGFSLFNGIAYLDLDTDGKFRESKDAQGNLTQKLQKQMSSTIRNMKLGFYYGVGLVFVAIGIPSERTSYTMAAAYITQTIVSSPESKIIGDKVLTLINAKLDDFVVEASKKSKSSVTGNAIPK